MDLLPRKIRLALCAALAGEQGQDLVEYALILAVFTLGAIAGIGKVGAAVAEVFDKLASIIFLALK